MDCQFIALVYQLGGIREWYTIDMMYLCVGSDFPARKDKVDGLLKAMQDKRPGAELTVLDPTVPGIIAHLEQHISGMGLFEAKTITKGVDLCEDPESKEYIFRHLEALSASDNALVLSETSLTSKEREKMKEGGVKVYVFESDEQVRSEKLFYLGDLLLQKKKAQLWVAIQEELRRDTPLEAVVGILLWQTKVLHLSQTRSLSESGLKPFVYNKCVKANWTPEQAQRLHRKLLGVYHQARRGGLGLREGLEGLLLATET